MSHPKATGDRRSANQKLMTPIRLWYECLKAAEGCYFDPDCRAKADDLRNAHAVSEAWLKHALSDDAGQVYGFTRGKGLPEEMYGPLLAREAAEELDRKQRQAFPEPVCVGKATVGRFCCGTHDSEFNPIDELDVRSPLTPSALDEHCRDLLFHRAVIRQLHQDAAFKVYRRELRRRYPGQSFPWDDNPHWDRHSIANLQWPRDVLLWASDATGAPWRVQHIVLHVRGTPQVAGCGAGSQGRDTWGFTVVPHAGGHLVAFHHCIGHPLPLVPAPQVARDAWADVIGDAAGSPPRELTPQDGVAQRISRFLLVHCREVCLAPAAWHRWDAGKQDAVRDLLFSTITGDRFGGPPSATIPDVNLFA